MIYDSMENLNRYMHINPRLDSALRYLQSGEWRTLPAGRSEVDGQRMFVNVDHYATSGEKLLETHRQYVDIQCVVEGEETIGVAEADSLTESCAYDGGRDIAFWKSTRDYTRLTMRPGQFLILFPGEAHAPGMNLSGEAQVHKAVVKVLWKEESAE